MKKYKKLSSAIILFSILMLSLTFLRSQYSNDFKNMNTNIKLMEYFFSWGKKDCENFINKFEKFFKINQEDNFYLIRNYDHKLADNYDLTNRKTLTFWVRNNLHNYLKDNFDYINKIKKGNIDVMICLSKNEILLYRNWKTNLPETKEYFRWD